ncbi:MAG: iron ABC transporter permease [Candidatus Binataceae bacterium]|jgi:iron complex transport system permease protein
MTSSSQIPAASPSTAPPSPPGEHDASALAGAYLSPARMAAALGTMAAILIVTMIVAVAYGTVRIDLYRALTQPLSADHAILFSARLPRVLMGAAVGAVLAAVGAALQALVRNPLAEGGILGISGGGAFGAILALTLGYRLGSSMTIVPVCAFAAALLSTLAVYRLALVNGRLEPFSLLLIGVIFNAFWGALILLVNALVDLYQVHSIIAWLMGSLEAPTYYEVALVGAIGLGGFAALFIRARDMNLLSLGDDAAADLGVNIEALRRTIFIATSLMIGAAVSVSGIISFVGLIVPHILRLMLGADHRLLLPASVIGGAALLVAADLIARIVIAPAELPVGVITALCGGPFFIYLLRREERRSLTT